jgi:hypothetical protein
MPIRRAADVRLSNRPFRVKRFQTIHHYSVDVAHGLVLLFGIGIKALPSWGFEDEVEQSVGRPSRQTDGRSKRTHDLTSSVVPRGTSFHGSVELEFPPIAFDPAWLSCCHQSTRCDRTQHPRSLDVPTPGCASGSSFAWIVIAPPPEHARGKAVVIDPCPPFGRAVQQSAQGTPEE